MLDSMQTIYSGDVSNFHLVTKRYGNEILHLLEIIGPVGFEERNLVYQKTLELNQTDKYFCVLSNLDRHANNLSFHDITVLDRLLEDGGIKLFYGATVSVDVGYSSVVKLANVNMEQTGLDGECISTGEMESAEEFIIDRLNEHTSPAEKSI
jgi:hypothetical protein